MFNWSFGFVYRGIVNDRELNSCRKPAGLEGTIGFFELTIHRYTNENEQLNVTYCYCCSKNTFIQGLYNLDVGFFMP